MLSFLCSLNFPDKNTGAISSSRGFSEFGDQTLLFHPLHWQVDSLPLEPPGKPKMEDSISRKAVGLGSFLYNCL